MIASNKSRTWFVIALVILVVLGARSLQPIYGVGQGISPDSPLYERYRPIIIEGARLYWANQAQQAIEILQHSVRLLLN